MNVVDKILGNIMECPDCGGDGLGEDMRTCKRCDGSGEIVIPE